MKPRQNMCSHLISSSSFFGIFFFAILRSLRFFSSAVYSTTFPDKFKDEIQSVYGQILPVRHTSATIEPYPIIRCGRHAGARAPQDHQRYAGAPAPQPLRAPPTASSRRAGAANAPAANNTPPPPAAQHKHKQAPLCNHFPTSTQTGASSEIPSIYSCWPSSCSPSPPPWAPWWTAS